MEKRERFLGSLLGLAIGDAVGTTLEFKQPGTFEPISEMLGGGVFELAPGEWTDDTSMALCLAESLVVCKDFNPDDQMQRYLKWYRTGYMSSKGYCFDIGNTTKESLMRYEKTKEPYSGANEPWAAGNGSIMRLAPVPLFYSENLDLAVIFSAKSSRTTHAEKRAVDGCRYLGWLLARAVNGVSKEELLDGAVLDKDPYWILSPLTESIEKIAKGSFKSKEKGDVKGSGYVVDCLEAALWAFDHSESFEEGLFMAVNLGLDADTTGAVYGQLAGAYYGAEGLPERMREKIYQRSLIEEFACRLYEYRYMNP